MIPSAGEPLALVLVQAFAKRSIDCLPCALDLEFRRRTTGVQRTNANEQFL